VTTASFMGAIISPCLPNHETDDALQSLLSVGIYASCSGDTILEIGYDLWVHLGHPHSTSIPPSIQLNTEV
jgi:hypothetical protein